MKFSSLSVSALGLVLLVSGCGASSNADSGMSGLDANGDGILDSLGNAVDADKDGVLDQIDIDQDGTMDGLGVDTNGDGFVDALGIDTNGDGLIDALDTNGDKVPDVFAPSGGTGGATGTGGGIGLGTGGGAATGGTAASSGGSGGGTINVGKWNAFRATAAEATLATEYASWKAAYLRTDCAGGNYSVDTKGGTAGGTVSEAIGYGMLITATLGEQTEFDGLAKFYASASKSEGGLMSWKCNDACSPSSCVESAASDGDLDVAMAYLQAEARWGGYKSAGVAVVEKLRGAKLVETCGSQTVLRPGEWGGCSADNNKWINPSYFAPGYYRVFANVDSAGAETWNKLLDDSYALIDATKGTHPANATIFPDWLGWNGSAFVATVGYTNNGYDACRVNWRLATDFAWSGESRAKDLLVWGSGKVDTWNWTAGYGNGFATDANSALFGGLALTGLAVSQEKADEYYGKWIGAVSSGDNAYFQRTLKILYLLVSAGKFPSTL